MSKDMSSFFMPERKRKDVGLKPPVVSRRTHLGCVPTFGGLFACCRNAKLRVYSVVPVVGTYPRYVRKSKATEARGFHSFPPAQAPKFVAPPLLRNREGVGLCPLRRGYIERKVCCRNIFTMHLNRFLDVLNNYWETVF